MIVLDTKRSFKDTPTQAQPTPNRGKIFIDENGFIRNNIDSEEDYGQFTGLSSVKNALFDESFKKNGKITNDKIEKCKDCQYRFYCPNDSSIREANGVFYKNHDCDFYPKSGKWH